METTFQNHSRSRPEEIIQFTQVIREREGQQGGRAVEDWPRVEREFRSVKDRISNETPQRPGTVPPFGDHPIRGWGINE